MEKSSEKALVWRETIEDNDIPFTYFTATEKELGEKELKESKEMENHVTTISKLKESKFELRSIAYCITDDEYV